MHRIIALVVVVALSWVPVAASPAVAADGFNPRPGPTFNSPLGRERAQGKIFDRIIRSIHNTPRGGEIRILSWNFLTSEGTDALLRAQRRGVSVQLLMDRRNSTQIDNAPFARLRRGLKQGNQARRAHPVPSWARLCAGSCRGRGGTAHSKVFLFSQVGRVPRVVMQGSANFTVASTNNQWNDVYTHVRDHRVWDFYQRVWTEAVRDRKARVAFLDQDFGDFRLLQFPMGSRDPVMGLLDSVNCRVPATNTGGGPTRVRIAPDVIRNARGMALARKLVDMKRAGCDIKVGYTILGKDVGQVLKAGGVPMRHLVIDKNRDRIFDVYFHLKAMSIVGNVGGDPSGYALLNGSANWSRLASASDENLGIYYRQAHTLRYEDHIDYWFNRDPKNRGTVSARTAGPDRSGMLVFGTGADAVYEDGTPYSTTGVDPFALKPRN